MTLLGWLIVTFVVMYWLPIKALDWIANREPQPKAAPRQQWRSFAQPDL